MQQLPLTEDEGRVFAAVTDIEARGEIPFAAAIARQTGLSEERLRPILRGLADKGLLHREDSPVGPSARERDFGSRWCARQPT